MITVISILVLIILPSLAVISLSRIMERRDNSKWMQATISTVHLTPVRRGWHISEVEALRDFKNFYYGGRSPGN